MTRRRKKSAFDRALGGGSRKRRNRGGILGSAPGVSGKKNRRGRTMADRLDSGGGLAKRFEGGGRAYSAIGRRVAASLGRRLSPTERMDTQEAIDQAIEDNPDKAGLIRRLVALVVDKLKE